MAKSKEQKRAEALSRLETRLAAQKASGSEPTRAQLMEHSALRYPKRKPTDLEQLFGVAGDPVTGMIYADALPWDFKPTPELENIVRILNTKTDPFVELSASLDTPEGYEYPTYLGGGTYLSQWVARHTPYFLHHSKNLFGGRITVVFSRSEQVPNYDEDDNLLSGTTKEMYDRRFY